MSRKTTRYTLGKSNNRTYHTAQSNRVTEMPMTKHSPTPYNGTGNQTQIAQIRSTPDVKPSMLPNTRTNYRPLRNKSMWANVRWFSARNVFRRTWDIAQSRRRCSTTCFVKSLSKQSKAKMCNGRRHVPLCPASANEKYI